MFLSIYKHPHQRRRVVNCSLLIRVSPGYAQLAGSDSNFKTSTTAKWKLLHSISKYSKKHLLGL